MSSSVAPLDGEFRQKIKVILATLFILTLFSVLFFIDKGQPTGQVTFHTAMQENETFHNFTFTASCQAESQFGLDSISATLVNSWGEEYQSTAELSGETSSAQNFTMTVIRNGLYSLTCSACDSQGCFSDNSTTIFIDVKVTQSRLNPVINMTFDDELNPWRDYSNLNHQFVNNGAVLSSDWTECKWYACADMSQVSGDYLSSHSNFLIDKGLAISFWVKHDRVPTGDAMMYCSFGDGLHPTSADVKYLYDSEFGIGNHFQAVDGLVTDVAGSGRRPSVGTWYHYFVQYDSQTGVEEIYINGALIKHQVMDKGELVGSVGELIRVGAGVYNTDVEGTLDEFLVWNRGNFTTTQINTMYEKQREGTPPEIDIYIKDIMYDLPYDFETQGNPIHIGGTLMINITVANAGTNPTGDFVSTISIGEDLLCSVTLTLGPREEKYFTCPWTVEHGWFEGEVILDSEHDVDEEQFLGGDESNNQMPLYIPVENHPRFRFTQSDWDILKNSFTSSENEIGYASYNWYRSFVSEDFNPSWTIDNVDPRAKKGYENALNCYINNYQTAGTCARAMNHLDGWLVQITNWQDGGVQALHEFIHVAGIYDLMFPSFTEEEARLYAKQMSLACEAIYGKTNVRPHNDPGTPSPDNGQGFGMGLAGPCYVALGDYSQNPTMIWHDPQGYSGKNTVYFWTQRVENHLKGFKNDSNSVYPEGMLYYWYSKYHLVDVLQFLKISGYGHLSEYQNQLCAEAKEVVYNMLDYSYTGSDLRGDEPNMWRQVSYGDTNSYERPGNDGLNNWDVLSAFGVLCDDMNVKIATKQLRERAEISGDPSWSPGALYYYTALEQQVSSTETIDDVFTPLSFSSAFDRFTFRRGFTYQDDSLFIFDGGDQAEGGHPNAQFDLFVYVMGEPFLDYPQVPYEDDVRSEVWHNTISFSQSDMPGYFTDPYNAGLHQYYGGKDIQGSYPDFNFLPDGYRGDVLDVIGTDSGDYAAFHAYHPYETATEPVVRDVVIIDDLLVHRDSIKRDTSGPIYMNWINIYDEFPSSMNGNVLSFTRAGTTKQYKIIPVWSSSAVTLSGGDSGKPYCFQKTSCTGGKGNYGKYYHEVQGPQATVVFAHHWFEGTSPASISSYLGTDKGVVATYSDHVTSVIFDTDEDGSIVELGYSTDAWSLTQSSSVVAVTGASFLEDDTSALFTSSVPVSMYINTSFSHVHASVSATEVVSVSLRVGDASSVVLNGDLLDYGEYELSLGVLDITLPAGVHDLLIQTSGDAVPRMTFLSPAPYEEAEEFVLSCSASDNHRLTSLSISLNDAVVDSQVFDSATASLSYTSTLLLGEHSWYCQATDNASQTSTSPVRYFTVVDEVVAPEEEPETSGGGSGGGSSGGGSSSSSSLPPVQEPVVENDTTDSDSAPIVLPVNDTVVNSSFVESSVPVFSTESETVNVEQPGTVEELSSEQSSGESFWNGSSVILLLNATIFIMVTGLALLLWHSASPMHRKHMKKK